MKKLVVIVSLISAAFLASSNAFADVGRPLSVLILGDSITQGIGQGPKGHQATDSFRKPLYKLFQDKGIQVDFVGSHRENFGCTAPTRAIFDRDHEGHWGWRVDEILNGRWRNAKCSGKGNLEQWLQNYSVDIALLHLGSNDAFQKQDVDETLLELEQVVATLRTKNPQVKVVFAQVIPAHTKKGRDQRVALLSAQIPGLVQRINTDQSAVVLVDLFTGFSLAQHSYDGVHPNPEGERWMAERWFKAVQALLD